MTDEDYLDTDGKLIVTGEALAVLRQVYNIDGRRLMENYGVKKLRVVKDRSMITADMNQDRITVYATLNNHVYAIERG